MTKQEAEELIEFYEKSDVLSNETKEALERDLYEKYIKNNEESEEESK